MKQALVKNGLYGCLLVFLQLTGCFSGEQTGKEVEPKIDTTASSLLPVKDFLFTDDQPFPECHASTLIRLGNGEFITAWFGGTKEKDDDVGIWMTRGNPGKWEKPFEIAKLNNTPHWNPVLFQSADGKVFLFFKVGKEIPQWETWVKTSDDNGRTWSDAFELVKGDRGGRGPVRNKIIVLSNGTWLAGSSNENGGWNAFFDKSKDEGKTWQATPYLSVNKIGRASCRERV